jgi:ferric-dicitrate binding protein FerR (iron transport regulator)
MAAPIPRRALACGLLLLAGAAPAPRRIGEAIEVTGTARAERPGSNRVLAAAAPLGEGDTLVTAAESRLRARLAGEIELRLGALSRLLLDSVPAAPRAGAGTVLRHAAGPFWFTRPEGAPRSPVAVVSPAALIAVRGTSFWGGELDGVFRVFVARGEAEVTAGGRRILLAAGLGTEIVGGVPIPPQAWPQERINRALASVGAGPGAAP